MDTNERLSHLGFTLKIGSLWHIEHSMSGGEPTLIHFSVDPILAFRNSTNSATVFTLWRRICGIVKQSQKLYTADLFNWALEKPFSAAFVCLLVAIHLV
jgi:hypothetical protein